LKVSDESIRIEYMGKEIAEIKSRDVNEVVAFKRDLFTEDLICVQITFGHGNHERTEEIHEEMRGFDEVMAHLARQLPGFDRDWRMKVVKPAFEAIWTVLYRSSA